MNKGKGHLINKLITTIKRNYCFNKYVIFLDTHELKYYSFAVKKTAKFDAFRFIHHQKLKYKIQKMEKIFQTVNTLTSSCTECGLCLDNRVFILVSKQTNTLFTNHNRDKEEKKIFAYFSATV